MALLIEEFWEYGVTWVGFNFRIAMVLMVL
jgi:hypothetical protein